MVAVLLYNPKRVREAHRRLFSAVKSILLFTVCVEASSHMASAERQESDTPAYILLRNSSLLVPGLSIRPGTL